MPSIAVIDTETTGLDPARHDVWEVALILHDSPDADGKSEPDREYLWQLPVELHDADGQSLAICRFYERRWEHFEPGEPGEHTAIDGAWGRVLVDRVVPEHAVFAWGRHFATLTAGRVVVGAVPSFDTLRLERLLRRLGSPAAWHYRPVCVEDLAVAALAARGVDVPWPWKSDDVSRCLGVAPPDGDARHSALGDARWALELWHHTVGDSRTVLGPVEDRGMTTADDRAPWPPGRRERTRADL